MRNIHIKFVDQKDQNYDTVGDYGIDIDNDTIWFKITKFENQNYSIAILLHEIVEFFRNQQEGITVAQVDEFDYNNPQLDDPGLSLEAPYHKNHMEADAIERLYIILSKNDWVHYEQSIDSLFDKKHSDGTGGQGNDRN